MGGKGKACEGIGETLKGFAQRLTGRNESPSAPAVEDGKVTSRRDIGGVLATDQTSQEPKSAEIVGQREATIKMLKSNYGIYKDRLGNNIDFGKFEKYLRKEPSRIDRITRVAKQGGQLTPISNEGGKYQIDELSYYTPTTERNIDFNEAVQIAKERYGATLVPANYVQSYRVRGIRFNSLVNEWLGSSEAIIAEGKALIRFSHGRTVKAPIERKSQLYGMRLRVEV